MFTIQDIIDTLNLIEVRGKENLDRLLTAIMCLEAVVEAQKNPEPKNTEESAEEKPAEETKIYADEE